MQHLAQRVIALNTGAHGIVEVTETKRLNHELLEVDAVVGMLTAVNDVEHRGWQASCTCAAQVAPQRHATRRSSSVRGGNTDSQNRIRTQL